MATTSQYESLSETQETPPRSDEEDDSVNSTSASESDSSNLQLLKISFDPVSSKTLVEVNSKKKRGKRSKEKKRIYDKQKKAGTQATNQKFRKKINKQNKPKSTDVPTKNQKKKLRRMAFGIEVTGVDEVLDKRFEEESVEKRVRELQKKVLTILEQDGTSIQVVPDTDLLENILEKKVQDNVHDDEDAEASPAFFLLDLGTVVRKYVQWQACFPRVTPFYAIKCNPDPAIAKTISTCGGSFDCASVAEIKQAMECGATPEQIIFANPSKAPKTIEFARKVNVAKMTFDNIDELEKIMRLYPDGELLLRILGDDTYSLMAFGSKFGCTVPEESTQILQRAIELKANVVGVSFHVGSWCTSEKAFIKTLGLARNVFDTAAEMGLDLKLLDIGGGWPGFDTEELSFSEIARPINIAINEMFDESIRVIAEPGRYFVSECAVLATSIIARRERMKVPDDPRIVERKDTPIGAANGSANGSAPAPAKDSPVAEKKPKKVVSYYLADGVYGSFNNIFFDHAVPHPNVLPKRNEVGDLVIASSPMESTLFGPTCDSVDVIAKNIDLPKLDHGDWLYFLNMGAYTSAASSTFNGMGRPPITYILTLPTGEPKNQPKEEQDSEEQEEQ